MISPLLAAGLLLAQQVAAQQPRTSVQGTVVNSVNGEPVRKATVILRSHDEAQGISYADETDANGHFTIDDVQPGEYAISAQRQGFLFQSSGAAGAPPPNLKVERGEQKNHVAIKLTPLGVIRGRVLDSDGEPVGNIPVTAVTYRRVNGQRSPQTVAQVQTNAAGEFRLFGLRPGTYSLEALGQGRPKFTASAIALHRTASTNVYYPSTKDADHASPIELKAGAELSGFDITLQPSSATYSVRFELPTTDYSNYSPMIFPHSRAGFWGSNLAMAEGTITFQGLQPGTYDVVVVHGESGKETYARQTVDVGNADVDGGALTFLQAVEVTGSVRVEGGIFQGFTDLQIILKPDRPNPGKGVSSTSVKADRTFQFHDVSPDIYEVLVNGSRDTHLKSVRIGDQTLKDRRVDLTAPAGALTIVLGADAGQVEGSVKNSKGEPVVRARVNVIAYGDHADRQDLNRFGFTDEKGEFKIKNVPPGEYKVFAWEDVPVGAPQDAEFRKPFEKQAVPVKLQPNGHEKVEVTVISAAQVDRSSQ